MRKRIYRNDSVMKISEGIKDIQFHNLIKYDFAKGFNLISEADELQVGTSCFYKRIKNGLHYILNICKTILSPLFIANSKLKNHGKIIFLLAPPDVQKRRKDIALLFDDVSNLTDYCDQLSFTYHSWHTFSIYRSLYIFYLVIYWFIQLIPSKLSLRKKIRVIYELSQLYDFQTILKNINISQYNLALVFYDANLYNNFFVQFFKNKGCKTATLQHGIMVAARPNVKDNLDFKGIEFTGSISDYFLAWNEFTKREAIKGGILNDKIKVLGVAKCIGQQPYKRTNRKKNCLGILLDGIYSNSNNEKLIRVINKYSLQTGTQYILKYHPAYKGNEFESLMNENGSTLSINSSLKDLIECSDGIIVANSTALFELAYLNVRFYRFKSEPDIDKFRDLMIPMFSTEEELKNILENDYEYSQNIRIELCGTCNDVKFSYASFLNEFIYEK